MAKVKNIKAISRKIQRLKNEFLADNNNLKKIADENIKQIKLDARNGIGFDGKAFPSLSTKTIQRRDRLSTVNTTHPKFIPNFSNATFMGDTIDKITYKIKNKKIELFGKGSHRFIIGVRGKRLKGSNAKISEIIENLEDMGWKILGVNDQTKEFIVKRFVTFIKGKK